MSAFGHWHSEDDLPVFIYDVDHRTVPQAEWEPRRGCMSRRHWVALGNRRLQIVVDNEATVSVWDANYGLKWLTAPSPTGTGISVVEELDGCRWGSSYSDRPAGTVPIRTIGPTWFRVAAENDGLELERTVWVPEGEVPWLLIEVRVRAQCRQERAFRLAEEWAIRPRTCNWDPANGADARRRELAENVISYRVESKEGVLRAVEERNLRERGAHELCGPPVPIVLETLGGTQGKGCISEERHPTLSLVSELSMSPGEERLLWYRFGVDDGTSIADPAYLLKESRRHIAARLPKAHSRRTPIAAVEVPWHTSLLTGGACADAVMGGHVLDQGSVYSFEWGVTGAARDTLQHALPLVYCEPDLALSVLCNTCSWGNTNGELPYGLDGMRNPWTPDLQPSDLNLWALWLAVEYSVATGDLAAFRRVVEYHPARNARAVTLREHLLRQFRFFVDVVGTGEHGHVRIRNADWNDDAVELSGVERRIMIASGESVLNSAFAAWVLPRYGTLCERLGDYETAVEARQFGHRLRAAVAAEWNGRWYRRAYGPGVGAIGEKECWLEVQPWAILCGAAPEDRGREVLATIDELLRRDSPLGARVRQRTKVTADEGRWSGEGTEGGIWFAINMTLVWAAAHLEPEMAWDEWRRMSLAAHTEAYPNIWAGTLSGPDCYNAPESRRPGETWDEVFGGGGMQMFPVNNLHSHSQPLLAYLRLLGVEPTEDGSVHVGNGGGGSYSSRTFCLRDDGSGWLRAEGHVRVQSSKGGVIGGPGNVRWL